LYELVYLKKIPSKASIEMKIGSTFHKFAQDFFENLDYRKLGGLKTVEAHEYFLTFIDDMPPLVKPLCENFIGFELGRLVMLRKSFSDPMHYFKPIVTEFEYEAKNVVPGVNGFGHIDRIDYSTKDTLVVVEYKTSKRMDVPTLKRELTWYVLSVEKTNIFDTPITHIACYNPRINQHFVARVTTKLRQVVKRRVLQLARAHRLNLFPRRESMLCRWCSALPVCLEEEGFGGDWGIVLEPTNLKVMTAEKGLAWYHFTVKGKPTHASRPERGINAINKATKLMLSLLDYNREIGEKSHPLCGRSLCSITMINAGTKENVIPESCWLAIDRRIVPGETIQRVDEEIDSIIRRLRDEDSEFECEWNRVMLYESAEIPVDHEIAKTIRIKTKEITGSFPEIGGTIGSTDQRNFINDAGIPAISWGSGYGKSHEQDEYVEIKQVVDCAKILVATIFELLK